MINLEVHLIFQVKHEQDAFTLIIIFWTWTGNIRSQHGNMEQFEYF